MDEVMLMKCFQIISSVGMARSCFVQAMEAARKGDFESAEKMMDEGNESLVAGHVEHTDLVQQEAAGNHVEVHLFLVHAEDQLMSAETCKIMAGELLHVYRMIGREQDGGVS